MNNTNPFAKLMLLNNDKSTKKPSTIVVRLYDDNTFDIEQFHTSPEYINEKGDKYRYIRSEESVNLFTLDKTIQELKKEEYAKIIHRTPQDYRQEINTLKRKIRELEARLGD